MGSDPIDDPVRGHAPLASVKGDPDALEWRGSSPVQSVDCFYNYSDSFETSYINQESMYDAVYASGRSASISDTGHRGPRDSESSCLQYLSAEEVVNGVCEQACEYGKPATVPEAWIEEDSSPSPPLNPYTADLLAKRLSSSTSNNPPCSASPLSVQSFIGDSFQAGISPQDAIKVQEGNCAQPSSSLNFLAGQSVGMMEEEDYGVYCDISTAGQPLAGGRKLPRITRPPASAVSDCKLQQHKSSSQSVRRSPKMEPPPKNIGPPAGAANDRKLQQDKLSSQSVRRPPKMEPPPKNSAGERKRFSLRLISPTRSRGTKAHCGELLLPVSPSPARKTEQSPSPNKTSHSVAVSLNPNSKNHGQKPGLLCSSPRPGSFVSDDQLAGNAPPSSVPNSRLPKGGLLADSAGNLQDEVYSDVDMCLSSVSTPGDSTTTEVFPVMDNPTEEGMYSNMHSATAENEEAYSDMYSAATENEETYSDMHSAATENEETYSDMHSVIPVAEEEYMAMEASGLQSTSPTATALQYSVPLVESKRPQS